MPGGAERLLRVCHGFWGAPVGLRVELTEFVGRRAELALVRRALDAAPLVTLTGPGGKTRLLALQVTSSARRAFCDEVRLASWGA